MRASVAKSPNGSPLRSTIGPSRKRPRRWALARTFHLRVLRPPIESTRPGRGSGQFDFSKISSHSLPSAWSLVSSYESSIVSPRCAYDCPSDRFTESPSSVRRERTDIAMNTKSTRYERYESSSTPVETATMNRTSHRTAKRHGFKGSGPQRLSRGRFDRDRGQDLGDHGGRRQVLEPRLRLKNQPMGERRPGERLHVVRYDVVAAVHRRVCLRRTRKRERSARRSAEIDIGMRPRRGDDVDHVLF